MQANVNGIHKQLGGPSNGHDRMLARGLDDAPSQDELERELPEVLEGQVSLGELLSRVSQSIYAELTEMADTLPNMSDPARKRTIADWVVRTKKQVVKLYAVMKWSRDARDVQKAMNITAFLMDQNRQFEESIQAVGDLKGSLAPARLRNHDLLTSLDVLTTGTYTRLPSAIKKFFIPPEPLTDNEVSKTLREMDFVIKYRLRMSEIIPCEMSQFTVEGGRAYFTAPDLFRATLSLRGAKKDDGWFFVNLEFLHDVDEEAEEMHDFPRIPSGDLKRHVTEEADSRLNFYTPIPEEAPAPGLEPPSRPQLPPGTADAPLVRLFNFLQMMSLTYQLEILFYQASRMRSLGWREYLNLKRSPDGKSFVASYWIRNPQNDTNRHQQAGFNKFRIPPVGGTLSFSLIETHSSKRAGGGPCRTAINRILADLQRSSKVSGAQPSDEVETFTLDVRWEPTAGALGISIPPELLGIHSHPLVVNRKALNFEHILQNAISKHIDCVLAVYQRSLINGTFRSVFARPGDVVLEQDGTTKFLRVSLCANESVVVSIDPRTGKITLRDVGELAAAGRGPRFAIYTERLAQNPLVIYDCLVHLRYNTILELVEQKAHYLGLQTYRNRNLSQQDYARFGPDVKMHLFIRLAHSPVHYLVVVITETEFRFALVKTHPIPNSLSPSAAIVDFGWLDVRKMRAEKALGELRTAIDPAINGTGDFGEDQFRIDTGLLREAYAYCCARVVYARVEIQLKLRAISYQYINTNPSNTSDLSSIQSSLSRSIPGLCVQSSALLAGAPAAEAAMPNIRIIPLNWWSSKKLQVVTCVKLKYVQQPVGKRAGTSTVIRPSKHIVYDTREAVVSFLSENIDSCVDEFLEEWPKVSKIVVIAREVAQMSRRASWDDVRLLSFDLQTVEFAYAQDYTVAITCTDQLLSSSNSSYDLAFSRVPQKKRLRLDVDFEENDDLDNPHEDSEPFLRHVLRQGPHLSSSLYQLVSLLRNTLPVVCVLDSIRKASASGRDIDAQTVGVDTFAKASGWFRILYGDMRHALDFRILSNRRVAIIDAAYISHPQERTSPSIPGHRAKPSVGGSDQAGKNSKHVSFAPSSDDASSKAANTVGLLRPIPDLARLVREAALDAVQSGSVSAIAPPSSAASGGRPFTGHHIALLDIGIVCSVDDVEILALRTHSRIVRLLSEKPLDAVAADATAGSINSESAAA